LSAHIFYCIVSFFFIVTAATALYPLSLHDALPIWSADFARTGSVVLSAKRNDDAFAVHAEDGLVRSDFAGMAGASSFRFADKTRSEEHTSELQSLAYLVCRLLLEKKKKR